MIIGVCNGRGPREALAAAPTQSGAHCLSRPLRGLGEAWHEFDGWVESNGVQDCGRSVRVLSRRTRNELQSDRLADRTQSPVGRIGSASYIHELAGHLANTKVRRHAKVGGMQRFKREIMSKIFVNIGLSLDGYMAPEGMTMENWDTPEYKNWGAKWGQ